MVELRQLAYFVAIVDEASISRAAKRLQMTQPPLTLMVRALEKELGTELLQRHARGVTPTAAGRQLAAHARRLLSDASAVTEMVRSFGQGATGVLTLAVVPSASWQLAPELLRAYHSRHPGVHLMLEEAQGPLPAIDAVRRRTVDAAILYTSDSTRLTRVYAEDLAADDIRQEPMMLLLPTAQLTTPVPDVRDLADRTWLTTATDARFPGLNEGLRQVWSAAGIQPPTRVVPTLGIARMFVEAGIGIAPTNASAVAGLSPAVTAVTAQQDLPPMHATLIRSRNEPVSVQLERLIATAHEHVPGTWHAPAPA